MNYIENVFICISAPIIIAVLFLEGSNRRIMAFFLGGMVSCLLSSYISTFLAAFNGIDAQSASMMISPMVEETMKLMPVMYYILVFEPSKRAAAVGMVLVSLGFATFENVCYLTQNGAGKVSFLLIRGFGTGAMHVVCGLVIGVGLIYLWDRLWIRVIGLLGLLALVMNYHGIYNMLVSQPGILAYIGCLIPLITVILGLLFWKNPQDE